MNYRAWQLKNADTAGESALLAAGYGPLLARVLACRGIAQPQAAAALLEEEPPLSDPFLLKDMDKAVARIQQAIENGETIVIFGDYDVDGVSATAILYECLTNLGAQVRCKLPTREGGGYGLNRETLQKLADKGYKLIVTVDNGISAIEEADLAAELGIELVITDHHLPAQQLPKAVAVVDPKREDDTSPFKDLCGAGVAFKLCAALEGCEDPAELLEPFGELAALGTIADVMPLVGENRTIVKEGLATLQDTLRPGLQALLENAGYADRPVTAETVSYGLAPRLNAAGRMDTAAVALKLLLCENEEQAAGIAARLSEINTSRQQAEQKIRGLGRFHGLPGGVHGGHQVEQGLSLDILHDVIAGAVGVKHVKHLDNAGMVELGQDGSLLPGIGNTLGKIDGGLFVPGMDNAGFHIPAGVGVRHAFLDDDIPGTGVVQSQVRDAEAAGVQHAQYRIFVLQNSIVRKRVNQCFLFHVRGKGGLEPGKSLI